MCLTYKTPVVWCATQEHYPAVDRDQVKAVMSDMVQAGRLQHVPNNPFLVRMGGVVRKLEEQRGLPRSLHEHAHDEHEGQRQGNGVIDDKVQHTVWPASTLLSCSGLDNVGLAKSCRHAYLQLTCMCCSNFCSTPDKHDLAMHPDAYCWWCVTSWLYAGTRRTNKRKSRSCI